MKSSYTVKDIQVLRGLEAVRKRPGMYIGNTGSEGLHQLLWEIIDNSVDEALNGHCDKIEVVLCSDGRVSVKDNGRGIPTDVHPVTGKNTVETIFCNLHAGGKFDEDVYKVAGGLHGVGASVVNALSETLFVEVQRDGFRYVQEFSRGNPVSPLKRVGHSDGTGTTVVFRPDPAIFTNRGMSREIIIERLKTKAFLIAGLYIVLRDESTESESEFYYPKGIKDFLEDVLDGKQTLEIQPIYISHSNEIRFELAMTWTTETSSHILSFVNSIPTPSGGTHETGLKNGISRALKAYMEKKNGLPKGIKGITSDDVREGLVAILSVFLHGNLEFQGQTKDRLNSPMASQVEPILRNNLETWLHQNPSQAAIIANRIVLASQARQAARMAREEVAKKSMSRRLALPGKLADCSISSMEATELFIVEGDSAGGSSKQARDRKFQAVLPIRGKILNVEQASLDKLLANKEIQSLIQSIGTNIGQSFDYSRLRYGKIIINTDADVDGHHIATLLLTFFYRYLPELVRRGHVYIAMPPLYRVMVSNGKKTKVHYVFSDAEKDRFMQSSNGKKVEVQRFKGLGEMDAATLKSTTMDPATRTILKVGIKDEGYTNEIIDTLMGKDVRKRFVFIKEHAKEIENLDV